MLKEQPWLMSSGGRKDGAALPAVRAARPPRWNAVDPERDAGACQAGRRQAAFDSSGVWVIKYRARLKGGPQVARMLRAKGESKSRNKVY